MLTRLAIAAGAVVLAACTSNATKATTQPAAPTGVQSTPTTGTPTASGSPDAAGTVWLCRPGLADNPCASSRTSTAVSASGAKQLERSPDVADPPIDCFYVYPTVSTQSTPNANLHIDPEETAVAIAQASRFAPDCRIYAPMYPQLTTKAISAGVTSTSTMAAIKAYVGVENAWNDYLAHDNHGRGVVLIGHSQGAFLLTALIQRDVEPNEAVRKRLVSAILLGGNVTVPQGKLVGGAFTTIAACTRASQVGCVVAYSSFDTTPPANSLFGRAATGIGANFGGAAAKPGMQVLCTDPARLDGSAGQLRPYFPTTSFPGLGNAQAATRVGTPWVNFPDEYTGSCRSRAGATWLQVRKVHADESRPVVPDSLGPTWGLHVVDVNIALGNLVTLVARQARAYLR